MILKKLFATAAMAMTVASLVLSVNVTAMPTSANMYTYYSDATMTNKVGEAGTGCQRYYSWGIKTTFYTLHTFSCG